MALSVSAFAVSTTFDLKIENDVSGYTYTAYQIFKGDISTDNSSTTVPGTNSSAKLSNIDWATGVNGNAIATALTPSGTSPVYTAAQIAEKLSDGTITVADFTKAVEANLATVAGTVSTITVEGGKNYYKFSSLPAGYYFVKNTAVPTDGSYTQYMLELVENSVTKQKGNVPTVEKKVKDNNTSDGTTSDWQDSADHDIGDTIEYKITGTLSDKYADYTYYHYEFTDEISKGLTYTQNSVKVLVDGDTTKDITSYFDISCTASTKTTNPNGNVLSIKAKGNDLKAQDATNKWISATSKIVVLYNCTLNTDAVIGSAGNPNTVDLTFANDPNYDGTGKSGSDKEKDQPKGKTPEDKNTVFTFTLDVDKVEDDGNGGFKALKGAGFTLYKWDNTQNDYVGVKLEKKTVNNVDYYYVNTASGTVQEIKLDNGGNTISDFTWYGLDDGKYKIVESTTPTGYNTMTPIEFIVKATHDVTADNPTLTALDVYKTDGTTKDSSFNTDKTNGVIDTDIENVAGTVLPETGGIGVNIFYAIGGLMALCAIVLAKKRVTE